VLLAEAGLKDLVILTVDHRLRAGSAADADAVGRLAGTLGLPFERLIVRERPAGGSLQAFARSARYALLREAAARRGLAAIVTAHTLDDQAETFLLRLARGSGLKGLAAMRPVAVLDGLTVLRPFLGVRRDALREALKARGIGWREDPSNADPRFDRIAMRNLMPRLQAVGLSAERLSATAGHLRRASEALEAAVEDLVAAALTVDRAGGVRLLRAPLLAAAEDVRLRVLAEAVRRAGGQRHGARFSTLEAAAAMIQTGSGRRSLGRAVLEVDEAEVRLWRELRGLDAVTLAPGQSLVWDGRYHIVAAGDAPPLRIAPLGTAARHCPVAALEGAKATAPGVFLGETLAAAPTLGVRRRGFGRHFVRAAQAG